MTNKQEAILLQIYKDSDKGIKAVDYGVYLVDTQEKREFIENLRVLLDNGYIKLPNTLEGVQGANKFITFVLNPISIESKGIEFIKNQSKD